MAILRRTRLLPAMSLLALHGGFALAQINPQFSKVLASASEQKMVAEGARQSAVIVHNPCADAHFSVADKVAIIQQPTFTAAGVLRAGTWKQVVDYKGCGKTLVLNVLVNVVEGQRPSIGSLLPGATLADARLQTDVFRSAAMKVHVDRWRDPSCAAVYVADTALESREPRPVDGGIRTPWRETWTVAACERRQPLSITFTPDASGVSFAIDVPKASADKPAPAAANHP